MYVTPKEAVKYYNVSDNALRLWANDGRIKYITTKGGHRRYLLEQPTDGYDNEQREEPRQEHTKLKRLLN